MGIGSPRSPRRALADRTGQILRTALTPQGLASRPHAQVALAGGLLALNAVILVVDLGSRPGDTLGPIAFLPMLAAGWLLSAPMAVAVAAGAMAFRVVAVAFGGTTPLTGIGQCVALGCVAAATSAVAGNARRMRREAVLDQKLRDRESARRGIERAREIAVRTHLEVARRHSRSHDVTEFLAGMAAGMAELVGASRVVFFRLDGNDRLHALPGAHGVDPEEVERLRDLPCSPGDVAGQVVHADRTIHSTLDSDPRFDSDRPFLALHGASHCVAVPWRAGDECLGALCAYDSRRRGGFTDEEAWVLRSAALAAGLVWQIKQAEAEEQRRHQELALVQQAARALAGATDLDSVMRQVVVLAAGMAGEEDVPPRHATLLSVAEDRAMSVLEYDAAAGITAPGGSWSLADHPALRLVVETGVPFCGVLADLPMPDATAAALQRSGTQAAVVCAVRAGGAIDGLLAVSARDGAGFTATQVQRLTALANLAGLAIGNAGRLELVRQDAERAAALEQAKSDFLRLASHELRGPIAVVAGYVDMLADGTFGPPESADVARPLPILQEKVREMNELIDQMLEMARLEDSRHELRLELVDVREIVGEAARAAEHWMTESHTLRVELCQAPAPVSGDARRLVRILTNLLHNAVKYSPAGGEVAIGCAVDDAAGQVEVWVSDQGLGIAPHHLDRLFTMFGRVVTPDNSHIPGTGLGLYLSQKLATLHGGGISVETEPGCGSTFRLTLPLTPEVELTGRAAATAAAEEDEAAASR